MHLDDGCHSYLFQLAVLYHFQQIGPVVSCSVRMCLLHKQELDKRRKEINVRKKKHSSNGDPFIAVLITMPFRMEVNLEN